MAVAMGEEEGTGPAEAAAAAAAAAPVLEVEEEHPYAIFQTIKGGVNHKKQRVAGKCSGALAWLKELMKKE